MQMRTEVSAVLGQQRCDHLTAQRDDNGAAGTNPAFEHGERDGDDSEFGSSEPGTTRVLASIAATGWWARLCTFVDAHATTVLMSPGWVRNSKAATSREDNTAVANGVAFGDGSNCPAPRRKARTLRLEVNPPLYWCAARVGGATGALILMSAAKTANGKRACAWAVLML